MSRPDVAAQLRDLADRVGDLDPARIAGELEALKTTIILTNLSAPVSTNGGEDRLLTVDQAAERLGVTRDWLRRRTELPFVVKLSEGVVRYSRKGLERFIATHAGK